jgi:inner membrane protein
MDALTNSLAAFTLGRTGLRNLSPYGTAILITAANLPDLDLMSVLFDPVNLVSFVGGPFHSAILAPVLAGLLSCIIWALLKRRISFMRVCALSLCGLALRLMLDVLPVHGVQLLYPLQDDWYALGAMPYLDPWLMMLLLAYAFWPLLSHFVDMELGIRQAAGQWLAYASILLVALYCGYRASNIGEATAVMQNHVFANETPFREQCYPDTFSVVRVHCAVETESQMVEVDYFTGDAFDPTEAVFHRKQPRSLWQVAQLQSEVFRRVEKRLRMPQCSVYPAVPPENGSEVVVRDLVLAPDPYPLFQLRLLMNPNEALTAETIEAQILGYTMRKTYER